MKLTVVSALVVTAVYAGTATLPQDMQTDRENTEKNADGVTVRALKVVAVREVDLCQPGESRIDLSTIHPCAFGLHVLLAVEGALVSEVVEYGHPVLSNVYDDRNRRIVVPKAPETLVDIDREIMFFGIDDPPEQTLWIRLELPLPERDAKRLSIEGYVRLVAAKCRSMSFTSLEKHTGRLNWPELESIGTTCTVRKDSDKALVVTFEGEASRIISATVIKGDDRQALKPHSWTRSWDRCAEYLFWFGEKIPDTGLALTVEVAVEKKAIDAPIRLQKLPLP